MSEVIDSVLLGEQLLAATGLLKRRSRRAAGQPWNDVGFTVAQGELLRHVRRHPGTSVKDAAEALGVAPNTVSTLVGGLVEQNLLVRHKSPADQRVMCLHLTDGSRQLIEQWRERRITAVSRAIAELSDEERAALANGIPVLAKVAQALVDVPENTDE